MSCRPGETEERCSRPADHRGATLPFALELRLLALHKQRRQRLLSGERQTRIDDEQDAARRQHGADEAQPRPSPDGLFVADRRSGPERPLATWLMMPSLAVACSRLGIIARLEEPQEQEDVRQRDGQNGDPVQDTPDNRPRRHLTAPAEARHLATTTATATAVTSTSPITRASLATSTTPGSS